MDFPPPAPEELGTMPELASENYSAPLLPYLLDAFPQQGDHL